MIYYFSGTGNSLSVAETLATKLGSQLVQIVKNPVKPVKPTQRVGFVFPVYCYDVPEFMEEFLKNLEVFPDTFYFAIATCGGVSGNALASVDYYLRQKGAHLNYGNVVEMPDNMSLLFEENYDLSTLATSKEQIESFVHEMLAGTENTKELVFNPEGKAKTDESRLALTQMMSPKKSNPDTCISCGTCVSVCSVNNITLPERTVTFGNACVDCLACVHWCPEAAISAGKLIVTQETTYHHPDIQVTDMAKHR